MAGDLDVVGLVIEQWEGNRGSIAALATTVCEAVRHGDQAAAKIITTAAAELVQLVETTRTVVGFTEFDRIPVSYSGGMFTDTGFLHAFRQALELLPAKYDLQPPILDPAAGAALYAAKRAGHPLTSAAVHQLQKRSS